MEKKLHVGNVFAAISIVLAAAVFVYWWSHYPRSSDKPSGRTSETNNQGTSPLGDFTPDSNNLHHPVVTTNITPRNPLSPVATEATSEPVSLDLARKAAETFLQIERSRSPAANGSGVNLQDFHVSKTEAIAQNGGSPLAYVHTLSPTGFVITSAQTGMRPIVGFSFKDAFPFQDSADNVLLHLLRADMTARKKALNRGAAQDSIQSNVIQWAQFKQKKGTL